MDFDSLTRLVMGNSGALAISWIVLYFLYKKLQHCEQRHEDFAKILMARFGISVDELDRRGKKEERTNA